MPVAGWERQPVGRTNCDRLLYQTMGGNGGRDNHATKEAGDGWYLTEAHPYPCYCQRSFQCATPKGRPSQHHLVNSVAEMR